MNSEILIYYDDNLPIRPFIVAPFYQQQDTLIMAPRFLVKSNEKEFINTIYQEIPNNNPNTTYLRVFNYNSYIVIAIIFSSKVKEKESERKGLTLVIGGLTNFQIYSKYSNPASLYLKSMISTINKCFNTNLWKNGADTIIELLNIKSYNDLRKELNFIFDIFSNSSNIFSEGTKSKIWKKKSRKKIKETPLPKILICDLNCNTETVVFEFYISQIEKLLKKNYMKKIDITEDFQKLNKTIILHQVDFQLENVSAIKKNRIGNNTIISLS